MLLGVMNLLVEDQYIQSRPPRLSRKWRICIHVATGAALVCFGHLRMQHYSDVVVALVCVLMAVIQIWTGRRSLPTQLDLSKMQVVFKPNSASMTTIDSADVYNK